VSNDAHSASVQTLATLGLFGTLAFLALLALLVRAILILWDNRSIDRRALAAISLYLFIYLTNSFISPITITHKYLFWAVAGVVIGLAYRRPSVSDTAIRTVKISAITGSVILLSTAAIFTAGQWNYLTHIEKYAIDSAAAKNYQSSLAIPCFMYFDAEMKMVSQAGDERAIAFAKETLVKNPRCIAAEMFLAKMYFSLDRMDLLKPHIYRLMEMAPARNETISIGMYYANRSKDKYVATRLQRVMQTLGLVYIPGKLG
jgi:hypothetical protein